MVAQTTKQRVRIQKVDGSMRRNIGQKKEHGIMVITKGLIIFAETWHIETL